MTSLHDVSHRHDNQPELLERIRIPPGTPILELVGLQKKYGAVEALKPATVTFLAGEITPSSAKTAPANPPSSSF